MWWFLRREKDDVGYWGSIGSVGDGAGRWSRETVRPIRHDLRDLCRNTGRVSVHEPGVGRFLSPAGVEALE